MEKQWKKKLKKIFSEYNLKNINAISISESMNLFKQLLLLKKELEAKDNDISIDFNKNNFILNGKDILLVDLTPPLFKCRIEKFITSNWLDKKHKDLLNSYIILEDQILSILHYWVKTLEIVYPQNNEEIGRIMLNEMLEIIEFYFDKFAFIKNLNP